MTEPEDKTPSGLRYQMDRQVQRIGSLRTADRWALRDPSQIRSAGLLARSQGRCAAGQPETPQLGTA
jgi:hypothetical protein